MIKVEMRYNAYLNAMKITANDQPLTNVSSLTRFQASSFLTWCNQILPALANEVNDDYTLTYIGRSCESRILTFLSAKCKACRSLQPVNPRLDDSTTKRLRKLHQLCVSGLSYRLFTEQLHVYSDLAVESVEGIVKGVLPKMCFCRIKTQYHLLADLAVCDSQRPRFVIVGNESLTNVMNVVAGQPAETFIMALAPIGEFVGMNGLTIAEKVTAEALPSVFEQYLELNFFKQILIKAVSQIQIDQKDANFPAFAVLDKLEPQTCAELPRSIELNESIPIKLYTIPEGYEPENLSFRISNDAILQIRNGVLYCVGTGEAVVEVYQAGQSVCINRTTIVAHRRNRIKKLILKNRKIRLAVGDTFRLSFDYEPQDADNTSTVRFSSDSGLIASAIDGVVKARKPGITTITIATDNNVNDTCLVEVLPKLEEIKLSLKDSVLPFNGTTDFDVQRVPAEATLDDLQFEIVPSNLAIVDRAGKKIAAKGSGSGKLVVTDRRKSCRAEAPFTVEAQGMNLASIGKVLLGIAIVVGLLFVFTR